MTRIRERLSTRTLLGRLTVGMLAILFLACAVLGVATELFVRGFLLNQLDGELSTAGGRYSASLEHNTRRGAHQDGDDSVPGQAAGTLGVRLVGGKVTNAAVVTDSGANKMLRLSASDQAILRGVKADSSAHSVDLGGVGDYRVSAVKGRDGDVQLTGLPLAPVNETLARLFIVEAGLFVFVFLVGGVATSVVVRRNLRPLHQLTSTALDVSEQELTDPETSLPTAKPLSEAGSEVDQLNVAFHRMLDRVQQALTARDATEAQLRQFIADASHELRTPLATIKAHAEYAATTTEPLPEPTAEALGRITAATDRMASLVADLLLLARLDAGRPLASDTVDLTRLVLDAVTDARIAAPDHHWRIDVPQDIVTVTGDDERLHQVLENLLSNARHHTPPGTTVTTRLAMTSGAVDLSVDDDGPGIPVELVPRLFDRFFRGDTSRSRSHGSSGLGLAIADSIIAAHGGSLAVGESVSGGATFTVHLTT